MKGKILFGLLCLALVLQPLGAFAQAATATVKLTWTDTINPAGTGYNVRRGNSATACTATAVPTDTCTLLNPTPLSVMAFTDTPAIGSLYTYNVKAVNAIGIESASSNFATVSLAQPAPVNVSCQVTVFNGVIISIVCK